MTTFGELTESISSALHSYTGVQEQVTWLESAISATDLVAPVGDSETVMRGIAEIDDELLYVHFSDSSGLTIAPFGRGYRGTTPATHSQNARVTVDPAFPRAEVKKAINQVVAGVYPILYRIKTTDLTLNTNVVGYELPADCEAVVSVKWQTPEPSNYWEPMFGWEFDSSSPTTTGKMLNLSSEGLPGRTIRVVYQSTFGTLVNDADTLASAGITESQADLIMYGVCSRMIRFLDTARLQTVNAENMARSGVVATGDAGKIANQLYAMYQQRLAEERVKLLGLTPPTIHFTR